MVKLPESIKSKEFLYECSNCLIEYANGIRFDQKFAIETEFNSIRSHADPIRTTM